MPRPRWPLEDEQRLQRLLANNVPIAEIASTLGKTIDAVYAKRRVLDTQKPQTQPSLDAETGNTTRVARMVYLTERIAQCNAHLSWRSMAA